IGLPVPALRKPSGLIILSGFELSSAISFFCNAIDGWPPNLNTEQVESSENTLTAKDDSGHENWPRLSSHDKRLAAHRAWPRIVQILGHGTVHGQGSSRIIFSSGSTRPPVAAGRTSCLSLLQSRSGPATMRRWR